MEPKFSCENQTEHNLRERALRDTSSECTGCDRWSIASTEHWRSLPVDEEVVVLNLGLDPPGYGLVVAAAAAAAAAE